MPLNLNAGQIIELEQLRQKRLQTIRPMSGYAPSGVIEPILEFLPRHLEGAHIFSTREELLNFLPKGGNFAEVGTHEELFAKKIYHVLAPQELHLFDIESSPLHGKATLPSRT